MKKDYEKPSAEIVSLELEEAIAVDLGVSTGIEEEW